MYAQNPKKLEHVGKRADLAERLRNMRWPEPTPEARRRTWELLSAQVHELTGAAPGSVAANAEPARGPRDDLHERRLRRHEFAKQVCDGYAGALGKRLAATRGLSRAALR